MLGSITPLGERGRGSRWGVTVAAYLVGSAAGGAALGASLGTLGEPLQLSLSARLIAKSTRPGVRDTEGGSGDSRSGSSWLSASSPS